MDSPDVPELALAAWEYAHGLRVTIHDLRGSLWPFLAHERFQHSQPICQAVKLSGGARACTAWEITRQRREMADFPQGRVQVCHAGLVEWVVPVFEAEALAWVLFAGVRSAAPELVATRDELRLWPNAFWQEDVNRPTPVSNDEAALLLEHLRQLAARLQLWRLENEKGERPQKIRPSSSADSLAARRTLILRFVAMHHAQTVGLADLAEHLGLSPTRASHAVRECCDATWQELMIRARLRTAMGLLRHSGMSAGEVALASGFESQRQFFRLFRRETGTTPLQYRKNARGYLT